MNRAKWIAAVLSLALLGAGVAAWAQRGDPDACVEACQDREAACVSACGARDNPVECEERCEEAADDCMHGCY